jgi:hypothetical protein
MNAEQYRALVNKLEAINEDPTADAAGVVAPAVASPNEIQTIEAATFNQAYAQARKLGLKKFKWCGIFAVKDKPAPLPVRPKPTADTLPTTRTAPAQLNVPNNASGRAQAGVANLI